MIVAGEVSRCHADQPQRKSSCKGRRSSRPSARWPCRQSRCASPLVVGSSVGVAPVHSEKPAPAAEVQEVDDTVVTAFALAMDRMATLDHHPKIKSSFHCTRAPALNIKDYILRIRAYMGCSIECFVLGLVYIDRVIKKHPTIISPLSVHRLVMTSMVLAAKFQDDQFYQNSFYAKVGGLRLDEMNTLELKMLQKLDWKLHVTVEEFELYRRLLCTAAANVEARR